MKTKSTRRSSAVDLDAILVEIGETGRYQIAQYVILCVLVTFTSSPYLSFIFTAGKLDYRCHVPALDGSISSTNTTGPEYMPPWLPHAVPFVDDSPDPCSRYALADEHTANTSCVSSSDDVCFDRSRVERCNEFVYATDEVTIVNAFNVTCAENDDIRLSAIGSLGYIAELIVLPICAVLSDRYGRRPILIGTLLLSGASGLLKSFATSYTMFALMEFITSIASGGTYMTIFVMAIEFSGPGRRLFAGTLMSAVYSFSQVVAGVAASYCPDFRTFLRVLYAPNLAMLAIVWLVPESVRWLLANDRLRPARHILLRAAKINGVRLSAERRETLYESDAVRVVTPEAPTACDGKSDPDQQHTAKRGNPFMQVMRSPALLQRLGICLFCWLTNSFIYFGMNVHSTSLGGDKYVNYILVNAVEVPAVVAASYLMARYGRKWVLCVCLLINSLACLATGFMATEQEGMKLTMFVVGKCGVTISFTVLYVYSSELFPTAMRHSFMNACSAFGSVGSIITTYTPMLVKLWNPLPLLMFASSAFVSGVLVLSLPETLNAKLPDTVEEAEELDIQNDTQQKDENSS